VSDFFTKRKKKGLHPDDGNRKEGIVAGYLGETYTLWRDVSGWKAARCGKQLWRIRRRNLRGSGRQAQGEKFLKKTSRVNSNNRIVGYGKIEKVPRKKAPKQVDIK